MDFKITRWFLRLFQLLCITFLFLITGTTFAQESDTNNIKQQALALYATKNFPQAEKLLDNLPPDEKNEEIYLILSNLALENNDTNLAIQNLNKALDKNPNFYKAYYNLGNIFIEKGSYILAQNNYELALENNKTNPAIYYNLAYSQMKLKNYKTAKKNLIKSLELEPMNKNAYYNLALCYKELNKTKQAKKILEKYNELNK